MEEASHPFPYRVTYHTHRSTDIHWGQQMPSTVLGSRDTMLKKTDTVLKLKPVAGTAAQFPHPTLRWIFSVSIFPWVCNTNKSVAPDIYNRNPGKMEFWVEKSLSDFCLGPRVFLASFKSLCDAVMAVKSALWPIEICSKSHCYYYDYYCDFYLDLQPSLVKTGRVHVFIIWYNMLYEALI